MSEQKDPMEFVAMAHPETGGVAEATRAAFEEVWEPRGWKLADDAAKLKSLSKDELLQRAAERGLVDVTDQMTKADIIARLSKEASAPCRVTSVAVQPRSTSFPRSPTRTRRRPARSPLARN